jgi:hypothetical protein
MKLGVRVARDDDFRQWKSCRPQPKPCHRPTQILSKTCTGFNVHINHSYLGNQRVTIYRSGQFRAPRTLLHHALGQAFLADVDYAGFEMKHRYLYNIPVMREAAESRLICIATRHRFRTFRLLERIAAAGLVCLPVLMRSTFRVSLSSTIARQALPKLTVCQHQAQHQVQCRGYLCCPH